MGNQNYRGTQANSGVTINNLGKTSVILLAVFTGFALGFAAFSYIGSLRESDVQKDHIETLASAVAERTRNFESQLEERTHYYREQLERNETETRMLEYYVMELDGKLMNKGIIDPAHSWSAQKQKRKEQSK